MFWGYIFFGGFGDVSVVILDLESGVIKVVVIFVVFVVLKDDGTVVVWGVVEYGGDVLLV